MDEPTKPNFIGNFPAFKTPMDETKSPPTPRRVTVDEAYSLVNGGARQQGFFLVAELLGRLIYGTWDKIRAARKKSDHADRT